MNYDEPDIGPIPRSTPPHHPSRWEDDAMAGDTPSTYCLTCGVDNPHPAHTCARVHALYVGHTRCRCGERVLQWAVAWPEGEPVQFRHNPDWDRGRNGGTGDGSDPREPRETRVVPPDVWLL